MASGRMIEWELPWSWMWWNRYDFSSLVDFEQVCVWKRSYYYATANTNLHTE